MQAWLLQPEYLQHFSTLSVLPICQACYLRFLKAAWFKKKGGGASTFHKEYHFGLEDNITSLPTKITYFLNASNQVKKIKCKWNSASIHGKWYELQNRTSQLSILSSAKDWKTTSKRQTSLCMFLHLKRGLTPSPP